MEAQAKGFQADIRHKQRERHQRNILSQKDLMLALLSLKKIERV
jgi:hypothetical protein